MNNILGEYVDDHKPRFVANRRARIHTDNEELFDLTGGGHAVGYPTLAQRVAEELILSRTELFPPVSARHFVSSSQLELCELVCARYGEVGARAYLVSGGTEAFEMAMGIAYWYQDAVGTRPGERRIIGRRNSYHGMSVLATNAADHPIHSQRLGDLDFAWPKLPTFDCEFCQLNLQYPSCSIACSKPSEQSAAAAVVFEPISGTTTSCLVPPLRYYENLRETANAMGALLIADEVMTGFRRTGPWFACPSGVADITISGKLLGAGMVPICAVILSAEFAEKCRRHASIPIPLRLTYAANPIATRIALSVLKASVEICDDQELQLRSIRLSSCLNELAKVKSLRVSGRGHLWSLDWPAAATREDAGSGFAGLRRRATELGYLVMGGMNPLTNRVHLTLTPPLDSDETALDEYVAEAGRLLSLLGI